MANDEFSALVREAMKSAWQFAPGSVDLRARTFISHLVSLLAPIDRDLASELFAVLINLPEMKVPA